MGLEGQQGRAKIFFDEFSTALLFFLILKKAFFVVFYAVCQKKEKLGNNEKTTLIFPGKIVSIMKLKIKMSCVFKDLDK